MVGPSKILTVSYGTFSCTLEGFDDPFSTMRGIAEYFRDLAADDRYFGAEPPTPDAEMLHRIAEREIHRRVEARVENNGIILRQMDDAHDKPASSDTETSAAAASAAGLAAAASRPAPEPQPEPETYDFTDAMPARRESVAEKLARIRASVARREDEAGQTYRDESHVADTLPASKLAEAFEDNTDESDPEADDLSEAPETLAAEEELADPEALIVEDEAEEEAPAVIALAEDETDEPVGDELPEDVAAEEETLAEPEVEDLDVEELEDEEPEVLVLMDREEPAEKEVDEALHAAPEDVEEAGIAEEDDELPQDDAEELLETSFENAAASEPADEDVTGEPLVGSDETSDEAQAEDEIEDDHDEIEAPARIVDQLAENDAEEEDTLIADEPADEPDAPAIARIMKMRRSDLDDDAAEHAESTIAAEQGDKEIAGADEDDIEDMNFSFIASADDAEEEVANVFVEAEHEPESDLSEEDEAGLMATLEQVQRESEAESRADKEGRAVLERQDLEDNGNDVQRILDVTNTELEETEGTRRRSAIQHLKAAVMATRADKKLAKEKPADDDTTQIDKYREDLARVVRPRRPADGVKPTERRQSPLVLVSEQRVDSAPVAEVDPNAEAVRPRRVSAAVAADADEDDANQSSNDVVGNVPFADAESFADFAEQMGATELPDLLEAAAAYASYVEGRPHFSRPQIMRAIAAYDSDGDFNREDSLRSFGQLLRHGKIRKLSRGQFTVARSTRFNPGARAAGE